MKYRNLIKPLKLLRKNYQIEFTSVHNPVLTKLKLRIYYLGNKIIQILIYGMIAYFPIQLIQNYIDNLVLVKKITASQQMIISNNLNIFNIVAALWFIGWIFLLIKQLKGGFYGWLQKKSNRKKVKVNILDSLNYYAALKDYKKNKAADKDYQ